MHGDSSLQQHHSSPETPVNTSTTRFIAQRDIAALMSPKDYLNAAEIAFRALAQNEINAPAPMHLPVEYGGFHAKGAIWQSQGNSYAVLKFNGNFPGNTERYALPTIQGVILLADASNGALLAILDSIEVTLRRTAAASALAARYLARSNSTILAICGCGNQGKAHAEALLDVLPINEVRVWDRDANQAKAFARTMRPRLGCLVHVCETLASATKPADVTVTCSTARQAFLTLEHVRPGSFIAAVGADSPEKNEIAPDLMRSATVVVDVLSQCMVMGDLHHAMDVVTNSPVELGSIVLGEKPGRTHANQITLFDSTGCAAQDAVAAVLIYERALARAKGLALSFAA